jgi:hypothetical protein
MRRRLHRRAAGSLLGHGKLCDVHPGRWNRYLDADPAGADCDPNADRWSQGLLPV